MNQSLPNGRPRFLTSEVKNHICGAIASGMSLGQAAACISCHPDTIRNERRRDRQFDDNVRRAILARDCEPMELLIQHAKTSWRAAAALIELRDRLKAEADLLRKRKGKA